MGLSSSIGDLFNKHIYSIVTAVIIAALTFGYLSYILPNNQQKEDAKNIVILQGIEKQLNAYIDDQVKFISDTTDNSRLIYYRDFTNIYIDSITINKKKYQEFENGTIKLSRTIKLLERSTDSVNNPDKKDVFKDTITNEITIDLVKFLNKIDSTTYFTSFYICPVEGGQCQSHKSFLSKNVSLVDQDSLIRYNRNNGPFSFKKSSVRYYTNQINIPQTNKTLFLAVGIQKSVFDSNVQQIDSNLLIFSLILVILLILGINFIKPVISSYKERLSQFDLVGVVFSIGLLTAILVIFATLSYWNNAIKTKTINDLEQLVNKIDKSFSNQIKTYENWKNDDSILGTAWKSSEIKFARIYLETDSKTNYLNEGPLPENNSDDEDKYLILENNDFKKDTNNLKEDITNFKKNIINLKKEITDFKKDTNNLEKNITNLKKDITNLKKDIINFRKDTNSLKLIKYLDNYFRMDNEGILTKDLTNTKLDIPRKYSDRMYFKILQQKNTGNIKTGPVLTAVFSRDSNKYQLIYAQKDSLEKPKSGIEGIAFREYFSDELELPPGTGYMIVDRYGGIILQNDPGKNLYQNLYYESQSNPEFASVLSGIIPNSFEMEYQGKAYQIYAKKLDINSISPIYILGVRDLSHLDRLSIFTFTNGFLIAVLYGFFIILINYIYSIIFYSGRISALSKHHFYYLFPDNSRTDEYKLLLIVNGISILLALIASFIFAPSIVLVFCIALGLNAAFINLITLSIRTLNPKMLLNKLVLFLVIPTILPPLFVYLEWNLFFAVLLLFSVHIRLVFHYRKWRNGQKDELKAFVNKNEGVNRIPYTSFLTARLLYQFFVFPFVLISAFYVTEINDFANYYCASIDAKEQNIKDKDDFIIPDRVTEAYNCNCQEQTKEQNKVQSKNQTNEQNKEQPKDLNKNQSKEQIEDHIMQKANLSFFDRPASYEIKNFTFSRLSDKYYLNSLAIFQGENDIASIIIISSLLIFVLFITILAYLLLNYYSNRFFFYDLMQVSYEKYYPFTKNKLTNDHVFIAMVNNDDIKKLIQANSTNKADKVDKSNNIKVPPKRRIYIDEVFDWDNKNEISPFLRMDFILNSNHKRFYNEYDAIWKGLPSETRYVLYDFALDHFVNYKNKDTLMTLMENGIIDCHKLTGRLKMMSLSFRIFILSKSKRDASFIQRFNDQSKNGTYSKFKFPIIIIAVSALILLMYLNKDSYDQVTLVGGSVVTVLALINKILDVNKSL
ncbi:hypothetical protein SAMN05444671_4244 [Flavobacterium sp. CF108]|uniref:hypothetical protein n=1 Tax=unclassified Flavobacterium TaxID=196869 RepID=UPI0008D70C4E|nr:MULTISPECIES: hypothetical protein [unclassified Flavobacterium]SEO71044.1 hypothetical protein SAMN04487978_3498 [Flavobacterium sp. fv08]SHH91290.1 hypothetical protein SAMN05444671_4244 [Flavobacterium sp. CF108]